MTVRDNIAAGIYENTLSWRDDKEAYRAEDRRLKEQFRQDLAIEYGVYQHAKEPKLFDLAWSEGHSAGYYEVEAFYSQFVELIN